MEIFKQKSILKINNLTFNINNKEIIKNLNLEILQRQTHVIVGPNGSGKSSLCKIICGHPLFKPNSGDLFFENFNITNLEPEKRSLNGIFLAFQSPIEISGLNMFEFLKISYNKHQIFKNLKELNSFEFLNILNVFLNKLNIKSEYLYRDFNVGFSGGERKKFELLQILLLKPKLIILDELDSGLDIDGINLITTLIKNKFELNSSIIIVTHNIKILKNICPDFIHLIKSGQIYKTGNLDIINSIENFGFKL